MSKTSGIFHSKSGKFPNGKVVKSCKYTTLSGKKVVNFPQNQSGIKDPVCLMGSHLFDDFQLCRTKSFADLVGFGADSFDLLNLV